MSIAAVAAVQSITVTPATRILYLEADTGLPIEGLEAIAVWRLRAGNLAGSFDMDVIRVLKTRTDHEGYAEIDSAVMVHWPVFPFSLRYREVSYLPRVFEDDRRYEPSIASSGLRARAGTSFLFFQRVALDGETKRISRRSSKIDDTRDDFSDAGFFRETVRDGIREAYSSCRRGWFCRAKET